MTIAQTKDSEDFKHNEGLQSIYEFYKREELELGRLFPLWIWGNPEVNMVPTILTLSVFKSVS